MSTASDSGKVRQPLLRPLRHPSFALLIAGQGVSQIGDAAIRIALIIFVVQLTGSATALGVVTASFMLPNLATFFISGMVADRMPRRMVMITSDVIRTVLTMALALLAVTRPPLAAIAVIYALFGVADGFFLPSYRSYLPQILDKDELYAANALDASARRIGLILGPAVGALLIRAWGPAAAFWADAGSFAVSVLSLLLIGFVTDRSVRNTGAPPVTGPGQREDAAAPARKPARLLREATLGISYLRAVQWLGLMIISVAVVNAGAAGSMDVVLPFFTRQAFGSHSAILGILYAVMSAGAFIGGFATGQYSSRIRLPGVAVQVALMGMGASVLLLALHPNVFAIILIGLFFGFSVDVAGVIDVALIQRNVPSDAMGRVSGADFLLSYSLMPLGVFITGILMPHLGSTKMFAIIGIMMVLAAAAPLASSQMRGLTDENSATRSQRMPAKKLRPAATSAKASASSTVTPRKVARTDRSAARKYRPGETRYPS